VVADLLEAFKADLARQALSCEIRRPASAGGVKEDALFEHPLAPGRAARVDYDLDLPHASATDPLLLAFDIALADGIKPGSGEDGVRFIVELDGRKIFSRDTLETRWQPHVIDLTPFAGQHVRLTLVTDGLRNTSYDWALWGNPRVLLFRNAGLAGLETNRTGQTVIAAPVGAIAVKTAGPFKLHLVPDSGEPPVEFANAGLVPDAQWSVRDFNFTNAEKVAVEWKDGHRPGAVEFRIGAYASALKLARLAPERVSIDTGDLVPVHVEVKNQGRGTLPAGEAQVALRVGKDALAPRSLPRLGSGETWRGEWPWRAPDLAGTVDATAVLKQEEGNAQLGARIDVFDPRRTDRNVILHNEVLRLEFVHQPDGFAFAKILARRGDGWTPVAVWTPLFRVIGDTRSGEQDLAIRSRKARLARAAMDTVEFIQTARDQDGVDWEARLRVRLETHRPVARIHYEWKSSRPRRIRQLLGPNLYVGDGAGGAAKTWGLFPGLEYLFGAETSSNPRDFALNLADRRTPDPTKITVPLLAVTIGPGSLSAPAKTDRFYTPESLKDQAGPGSLSGPSADASASGEVTVALAWDPLQRWDGEHSFPSARFASPNFDDGMANHHLGLFLPSTPDFVSENSNRAARPYELAPDKTLTLDAAVFVEHGPVLTALREYLADHGGLPRANNWPRPFEDELDVCRAGLLKTVWNEKAQRWSHCIGWAAGHAPGFAALLWLDSHIAPRPEAGRLSRDRVELAAQNMLQDSGPALFISQANCHILQWEFPFLYGYLPEALATLDGQVRHLVESQSPEGGWLYEPAGADQAGLGRAGDSVLGTCANRAATLLRFARITGDGASLAAGEKALRFMERFRVPRGGQTWECPMYEPDILAAAWAIRAYHDGFRATANPRWLHDAVYWAETGVPFVYLWSLPDKPMMLGATIPVFGSTFYTHTWLAVPVQWCGLVYAYHVLHLAGELEQTPLSKTDSPLPLALNFSPAEWRRVVELITVSAAYQQFSDGDRIGAYPDSISKFERRNPAFLNPEDILVNVLALHGVDPDVNTARIRAQGRDIVVSSGAKIGNLQTTSGGIRFQLEFFAGEPSHTLIAGVKPHEVFVDGRPLPRSENPVRREPGWCWDPAHRRTFLTAPHEKGPVRVEVTEDNGGGGKTEAKN
jgi:hypothetical protein